MIKFLRIEALNANDYESLYEAEIKIVETTDTEIVKDYLKSEYARAALGLISVNKDNLSSKDIATLKAHGWVHPSTITNREEKKKMIQEYYILNDKGHSWEQKVEKIDVDNFGIYNYERIANGEKIIQVVDYKTVLSKDVVKRIEECKEAKKKRKEQSAAARAKKAEKKETSEDRRS